jgi:hypothetical protein
MGNENLAVIDLKDYKNLRKACKAGQPFCVQEGRERFVVTKLENKMTVEEAEKILLSELTKGDNSGKWYTVDEAFEQAGLKNV